MTVSPMKVEVEEVSPVRRKLRIEIPAAEVTQEVERAYRKLGKQARVKGFRPGKVPQAILQLYYHKQVEQEVSEELMRRSLGEALKEKSLDPIDLNWPEPMPLVVSGEDFRFSVEVEVPPQFEVQNYRGLKLEAPEVEVGDESVEQRLEEIRQGNAVLKPRPENWDVKEGDFVVLDYQAYFNDAPVPEGKAENYFVEVGSGKFSVDFEQQLWGLTQGAEARITTDLPQDFFNPLLAGKTMEFQVKIQEVKEKVTPELDDAFAQNLGGNFQTIADLRQALREDIIKGKEQERQKRLEGQAMEQLVAAHPFEVPPSLIRQEQENIFREQWQYLQSQGVNLEGLNHEKMLESVQPMAERRVRMRLLLERLAAQEQLSAGDTDVDEALARIAANTGRGIAQVRKFYEDNQLLEVLRRQVRDEKTMKLILDAAEIVPATESAQEKE